MKHLMRKYSPLLLVFLLVAPVFMNAQINPNNHTLIVKAYLQYNEYTKALNYLEKVDINAQKNQTELKIIQGQCLYVTNKIEEATSLFLALNQNNPKIANYELAQCYAKLNKETFAVRYLELHLNSKSKKLISSIKSDEAFESINNSKAWLDLWNNDWYTKSELLYADADYEYRLQNYEQAQEILDNIVEKRASMHQAYWLKALIFEKTGDIENALYQITQACKIKARNASYQYTKARYEYLLDKINKANKSLNLAFAKDSSLIDFYTLQAQINMATKQEEKALQCIEQINEIIDYEPVKFIAAQLFFDAGDYLSTLKYINECIKSSQAKIEYYKLRAKTYYQSGVYAYAEKDYSFLLDYEPRNGELYSMRGLCRQKQDNRKGACSDWQKARGYKFIQVDEYLEKYCY